MKNLIFLNWLFFLLNAVKFNMVEGEGGGSAEPEAENMGGDVPPANSGDEPPAENNAGNTQEGSEVDLNSLPDNVQKYIKDLRGESAKYRTQLRNVEDRFSNIENGLKQIFGESEEDQVSPEEQINYLTQQSEGLSMQNAVLSIAVSEGLSMDQAEYLQFLLEKEGNNLGENEEITDELFDSILGKVRTSTSSPVDAGNTSVNNGGNPPQNGGADTVSLEQFQKMGYMEKVNLRKANEPLYNKLFKASLG